MGNIQISHAEYYLKNGLDKLEASQYQKASEFLQASLQNYKDLFGKIPENLETAQIYEALARISLAEGKGAQALESAMKSYKVYSKLKGHSHADTERVLLVAQQAQERESEMKRPAMQKRVSSLGLSYKKSPESCPKLVF